MRPEASRASSPNPTANLVGSRKAGKKRREGIRGVCLFRLLTPAAVSSRAKRRLQNAERLPPQAGNRNLSLTRPLVLGFAPRSRSIGFNRRNACNGELNPLTNSMLVLSRLNSGRTTLCEIVGKRPVILQ